MKFNELNITGCYEIIPEVLQDPRGQFVTTYHNELFQQHGIDVHFHQEYFSTSKKGVLRGFHFQTPPHAQSKLIYCIAGEVLDVLLDIRVDSPTFGQVATVKLNDDQHNMVFVPEGIAHGFYTLSDTATMIYKTSEVYVPEHDKGILWSSVDVWPDNNPVLSERDQQHPALKDFDSPFHFQKREAS